MRAQKVLNLQPPNMLESDPLLDRIRQKVQTCIQCGTCTGSCPNAFAMDLPPRQLWRLVLLNQTREIFESRTFSLCSVCYCCTLRCPQGLPLTEAMADLKQIAAREHVRTDPAGTEFYRLFLQAIRRDGRLQETYLMARYLMHIGAKQPGFPIAFTPLGMKLMHRGKLSLKRMKPRRSLERVFRKVEEMRQEESGR